MDKKTILVVDDEIINIKMLDYILHEEFDLKFASGGKDALKYIFEEHKPSLILLDVVMPEMDGFTLCKKIKSHRETSHIPIIFLTSKNEDADETYGLELGAVDYINKPISTPLLLARIKTHLALADRERDYEKRIYQRTRELYMTQEAAITMLGEAGHFNDNDTGIHIWRMADYARLIAQKLYWSADEAIMLKQAAALHDTGKIGIPDSILKANRKLTLSEWEIMKKHTTIGYSILSKSTSPLFEMAAKVALYHHEKWDGSGYPKGLMGIQIPEAARIVAIADVFDALTMKRPYKEAWPVDKAIREIQNSSGTHFDPDIVEAFISVTADLESVRLSYELLNS